MKRVILASASPRRQELLKALFSEFEIIVRPVDEEGMTTQDPWETAELLARAKATVVANENPDAVVIGGDTVVAYQDSEGWHQLTKPTDTEDAVHILMRLSGRTHVVITGVAVAQSGVVRAATDTTEVEFRALDEEEVRTYVATGEPMDKAGAYAIQGGAARFVRRRTGSLSNVIGLPIEKLRNLIQEPGE